MNEVTPDLTVTEVEYHYSLAILAFRNARTADAKAEATRLLVALRALRRTFLVAGGNVRCTAHVAGARCLYGEGHTIEHDFEEVL